MARRRGLAKVRPAVETPAALAVGQPARKHVIFGTPEDRKTIIILMIVGFLTVGLVYYFVAKDERPFPVIALLFTALHGALMGMLLGQLILVYPDRVVIIFTLLAILIAELAFVVGTSQSKPFRFNREALQAMTALFFWAGFVGFWIGYAMYARREGARQRYQRRFGDRKEELPPEAGSSDTT